MSDVSIALPDRYRVLGRIATGGMATVYRAEDGVLGREVAVKILAPHVAADPVSRQRFEREARTAARVGDHPNVVTIYDIGEVGEHAFIVMELYRGGTVADRLSEGAVARVQALDWLGEAAAGLDYAHGREVVHRDVKPANLLLDEGGRLAVGDFGIARLADESALTQAGTVLGTAAYLSPEQAVGEPATAASDRYSLGVVAFELLCGRRPFAGEHAAAQARQHVEAPMPETGLGPQVDDVMCRMLAKDPPDRYPTCALFVEELRHAVERAPSVRREPPTEPTRRAVAPVPEREASRPRRLAPTPPAPPVPVRAEVERPGPRRGWIALAALAAVALAVALVALLGGDDGGRDSRQARDEPTRSQPRETQPRESEPTPAAPPATEEAPPAETTDNEPETGPGPSADEESPGALNDAGYAKLQAGDAEGAIPLLERSVEGFDQQGSAADPTTFGYALYNLGEAYFAVGRYDEAIAMYERRLEVSPDDRPQLVRSRIKEARKRSKA
ncbi:MAG TPA: protein kinase [Solirubrobacteraceae bacterium]|jgi:serine/threonine-protein kinase